MTRASILTSLALAVVLATALPAVASLPAESPADTHQVNGPRVRSVAVVGDNVWIGGRFTQVQAPNGSNVDAVDNLAVLDRVTGAPSTTASPLALAGVTNAEVWKLETDGTTVYASGKFKLVSGGKNYVNLLAFDGSDGSLISSFQPKTVPVAQSVVAGGGLVYAGGKKLVAYDAATGAAASGFVTSTITTDSTFRPGHNTPPQHRDLQLIDGFLYSACQCDALTQQTRQRLVKALVRFDPATGIHDESFSPEGLGFLEEEAGVGATGISLAWDGSDLYLGAGGSDFVARYSPELTYQVSDGVYRYGQQDWKRDTSGSAQAVAVSGTDLLVGGHFVEVANEQGDACGFKSSDPRTLDPNDECVTRNRLMSYTMEGELQDWNPSVTGKYNGVWSIVLEDTSTSVHIGGEFTKVKNVPQTHYARLDAAL
jgi:hypothetical protein